MKIFFILAAIFLVLKLLTKHIAPLLLLYVSKKLSKKFGEQFQQGKYQQNSTKKETINRPKKIVGEYIDFEEID